MYKVLKRTCCAIDLPIRSFVFPCPRCCRSRGLLKVPIIPTIVPTFSLSDYCVKNQCQNDAKCVNRETNYTCACNSSGWTGKYCEKGSPFVKIISHF